jgi:DNA-binding transcriptional regulator YiaG
MKPIMQHDHVAGPVADHDYGKVLGAPFAVYLKNGVQTETDPVTGKTVTSITDLPGLVATVVRSRVLHPRKLSGSDLKFIRTALALKAKRVAEAVELSAEFYSRCEAGQKAMSAPTEKVYRGFVFLVSLLKDKGLRNALQHEEKDKAKKQMSPEEAQKGLDKLRTLFCDMKINPVFGVEEGELRFTFTRGCPDHSSPCGDDDAKWDTELIAA